MTASRALHARSLSDPAGFWAEQAKRIDWETPFETVLDDSRPPFAPLVRRRTHQPLPQRHRPPSGGPRRPARADLRVHRDGPAARLHLRPAPRRSAAHGRHPAGARRGQGRPRAGVHADDSRGDVRDAGLRPHRRRAFGGLRRVCLGEPGRAHRRCQAERDRQRRRGLPRRQGGAATSRCWTRRSGWLAIIPTRSCWSTAASRTCRSPPGRDEDYAAWRERVAGQAVPCAWLESSEPSYVLYTSGTTGKPKGVQRDTGGYAVALATSMEYIFCGKPGDTMFTASDIGWVVGHSLYRLRAAAGRHGHGHVRRHADPARWRHPVADRGAVRRQHHVHRAYGDPRAQEAGPGAAAGATTCPACGCCSWPASRWTNPPRAGSATASASPWWTTTGRPSPAGRSSPVQRGVEAAAAQARLPRRAGLWLRPAHRRRGDRRGMPAEPEGRGGHRLSAAAGLHEHDLGRRRTLRADLLSAVPEGAGATRPSTGACATRTATSSSWAAPTT